MEVKCKFMYMFVVGCYYKVGQLLTELDIRPELLMDMIGEPRYIARYYDDHITAFIKEFSTELND